MFLFVFFWEHADSPISPPGFVHRWLCVCAEREPPPGKCCCDSPLKARACGWPPSWSPGQSDTLIHLAGPVSGTQRWLSLAGFANGTKGALTAYRLFPFSVKEARMNAHLHNPHGGRMSGAPLSLGGAILKDCPVATCPDKAYRGSSALSGSPGGEQTPGKFPGLCCRPPPPLPGPFPGITARRAGSNRQQLINPNPAGLELSFKTADILRGGASHHRGSEEQRGILSDTRRSGNTAGDDRLFGPGTGLSRFRPGASPAWRYLV